MVTQWYEWTGESHPTLGITLNSFVNMGSIPAGMTLKRTRLDVEFDVSGINTSTATGFDINWWQRVRVGVGVFLTQAVTTAPNPPNWDSSATSGDWVIWDMQNLTTEVYDIGSVFLLLTSHRDITTLESFGERNVLTGNTSGLWLVWHIIDPSGLINTTTAAGVRYAAGYKYAAHVLTKTTGT